MKKNNQVIIESSFEQNGFVDFLKREFILAIKDTKLIDAASPLKKKKVNEAKIARTKKVTPKFERSPEKKAQVSELAFASKLTKSLEVFLADEGRGQKVFENNFSADWEQEYNKRQADLLKNTQDLISKRRKKPIERNSQISEYFKVMEDSKVRWTAIVLLLLNISIYVTLFHPGPTKLIVASLEAPVKESIIKLASSLKNTERRDGTVTENAVVDNSPRKIIDKSQLSNYIKNNNEKIKSDMLVSEEDLNGQVAGVSEER